MRTKLHPTAHNFFFPSQHLCTVLHLIRELKRDLLSGVAVYQNNASRTSRAKVRPIHKLKLIDRVEPVNQNYLG